ncbi:MAG: response regulator transcription factor [Saprospiraceae bacterium]|nr:response regulator transcription factor [Saprospiraceae bacterium]
MSNIRCLIVDDEPVAQRIIVKYLSELAGYEVVDTCLNAIAAMDVLRQQDVDLLFLDIEMPKLKGLAFLKTLQQAPHVIITTAHREYAYESYELEVLDYLLKPISFERFLRAINKFQRLYETPQVQPLVASQKTAKFIYVKSERKTLKLNEEDISYIEGMNNYIIIHHRGKAHIVYTSIGNMLKELGEQFLRIHKSFVVNRNHILSYSKEQVDLEGKELPIGKAYKAVIEEF